MANVALDNCSVLIIILVRPHVEYCISAWSPYYILLHGDQVIGVRGPRPIRNFSESAAASRPAEFLDLRLFRRRNLPRLVNGCYLLVLINVDFQWTHIVVMMYRVKQLTSQKQLITNSIISTYNLGSSIWAGTIRRSLIVNRAMTIYDRVPPRDEGSGSGSAKQRCESRCKTIITSYCRDVRTSNSHRQPIGRRYWLWWQLVMSAAFVWTATNIKNSR